MRYIGAAFCAETTHEIRIRKKIIGIFFILIKTLVLKNDRIAVE